MQPKSFVKEMYLSKLFFIKPQNFMMNQFASHTSLPRCLIFIFSIALNQTIYWLNKNLIKCFHYTQSMYSNFIFKIANCKLIRLSTFSFLFNSNESIVFHISKPDSKATLFESNLTAFCPKAIDIAIGFFAKILTVRDCFN